MFQEDRIIRSTGNALVRDVKTAKAGQVKGRPVCVCRVFKVVGEPLVLLTGEESVKRRRLIRAWTVSAILCAQM